ncbi:MAG: DNA topoisomerase subunit B [Candidatus Paceibacterota bacterium]
MAEDNSKENGGPRYDSDDINVLKGLDPVRKRPAMYIGSTDIKGLHHLIFETVDNAIDEAMMGHCDEITVTLLDDNKVSVTDNGRGIPIDKHSQTGKSGLETVMTTLHAGAKFENKAYQVSGGLHGVGVSVVCALSEWAKAEVCRDGTLYVQEYAQGDPQTDLQEEGSCGSDGTTISFKPDADIFQVTEFKFSRLIEHLRQQAFLTKGVKINIFDKREDKDKEYHFYFEGGLRSYIEHMVKGSYHDNTFYFSDEADDIIVEAGLRGAEDHEDEFESFANNIHTQGGGTHLSGFKSALTRTLNKHARKIDMLKEDDDNLKGRDIRENMAGAISVKVPEPQFEGQTKTKLGNRPVKSKVQKLVSKHLEDYFEQNPSDAKAIINKALVSRKARKAAKATRKKVLRKDAMSGLSLPGKLADCSSRTPEESELYIVEGDSAGGSAKQARDQRFQAILPIKGKVLNVERASLERMLNNKEIKSLIVAMGTAIGEDFDLEEARYHRIILMADADSDGHHIVTLLLTLFYRYFKPIIEAGYLYIAQPPLYKIKKGGKEEYAYTQEDKAEIIEAMGGNPSVQRYKGLGEMNPDQLWETTMNPENRVLMRVTIEDAQQATETFDDLMGKKVAPRKQFIKTHAQDVTELDV